MAKGKTRRKAPPKAEPAQPYFWIMDCRARVWGVVLDKAANATTIDVIGKQITTKPETPIALVANDLYQAMQAAKGRAA